MDKEDKIMKKEYISPFFTYVILKNEDICTTSGYELAENEHENTEQWWFN